MSAVVELHAVTKRYGTVDALAGLELAIEPGELVAVLGPNGAGKTTTFELLLGLARPSAGTVSVLGRTPGCRANRLRTGAMLQGAGLPEQVTVRELVTLLAAAYPVADPVDDVLARTALADQARRTVTSLSGGERQRLLLAMAIVGRPELLVLDEPTAAMDAASKRAFWEQADVAVASGTTVLFATHDLVEADQVAERVLVLGGGRLLADATPRELKSLVSGKVLTATTDAPLAVVADLPGVDRVDVVVPAGADGLARVVVRGEQPEQVVHGLLRDGWRLVDLTVADAQLEQAFLRLTAPGALDAQPPHLLEVT
ncbi:ABC transporter ATP-binding protein [Egicoccus halophilus]|uniref:ABC transporter ATP-binding protein n=1 Tax=Egicoccus halophilus TaxID=1670830 RepID=A0A8J3ERK6_9ACTN|nr:ABC transporter ATP-binding protein [Egicoccus halophilus]GGI05140.1 ABC transporter ATP-binding protein [Egicoccus halophilus]